MFIFNCDMTRLINLDHVVSINLSAPKYEQKIWKIVANLTYGTSILFEGTEEECRGWLESYMYEKQ